MPIIRLEPVTLITPSVGEVMLSVQTVSVPFSHLYSSTFDSWGVRTVPVESVTLSRPAVTSSAVSAGENVRLPPSPAAHGRAGSAVNS